jgi:16S rRNA (adenine1518-N6/adenine1519-N6)-dimethyltransferase
MSKSKVKNNGRPLAKKSFGQNFLVDRSVVAKIVAAAEIVPGEDVLEVGPGTGALTEALVSAGARVTAVEADRDLIPALRAKFGADANVVEADIFEYLAAGDPCGARRPRPRSSPRGLRPIASRPLPGRAYKVVANIPYNITSRLLETFLTSETPPSRLVLMVQREVADRLLAKPPDMSLLSVACGLYADASRVANVPAGAFRPAPKVDSAVVRLDMRGAGRMEAEAVVRVAKAGFASRRKQLHGNLAAAGIASSAATKDALVSLGLPPTARAENLTVHNWILLAGLL